MTMLIDAMRAKMKASFNNTSFTCEPYSCIIGSIKYTLDLKCDPTATLKKLLIDDLTDDQIQLMIDDGRGCTVVMKFNVATITAEYVLDMDTWVMLVQINLGELNTAMLPQEVVSA